MPSNEKPKSRVVKEHLGFAPNKVRKTMVGRMVSFAIDEKARYWGWFVRADGDDFSKTEITIVRDGVETPPSQRHVGSDFQTLDDGGLVGFHAFSAR